jgi:hypothetical protein
MRNVRIQTRLRRLWVRGLLVTGTMLAANGSQVGMAQISPPTPSTHATRRGESAPGANRVAQKEITPEPVTVTTMSAYYATLHARLSSLLSTGSNRTSEKTHFGSASTGAICHIPCPPGETATIIYRSPGTYNSGTGSSCQCRSNAAGGVAQTGGSATGTSSAGSTSIPSYGADLCPVLSINISSPGYVDEEAAGTTLDAQASSAAFFANPPLNPPANQVVLSECPQSLYMPLPAFSGVSPPAGAAANYTATVAAAPVSNTQLTLEVPVYFDSSNGNNTTPVGSQGIGAVTPLFFNHARVGIEVDALSVSNQWQLMTIKWLDVFGNNFPASEIAQLATSAPTLASQETQVVEPGNPPYAVLWQIPLDISQPVTTLRVGVWWKVTTSFDNCFPDGCDLNGPNATDIFNYTNSTATSQLTQNYEPSAGGVTAGGPVLQFDYSPPFQVFLLPTAIASAPVLPYAILYMPPGNQSASSMMNTAGIAQAASYILGNQQSTQVAQNAGRMFTFNGNALNYLGIPLGQLNNAAHGVQVGQGETAMSSYTTYNNQTQAITSITSIQIGSGRSLAAKNEGCYSATGSSPGTCLPPYNDSGGFFYEPFWNDLMIVMFEPVSAAWNYPAQAPVNLAAMLADVAQPCPAQASQGATSANNANCPSVQTVSPWGSGAPWNDGIYIWQLFDGAYGEYGNYPKLDGVGLCAGGSGGGWYTASQSQCTTVYLSPAECQALLQLDPFAAALTQNVAPPATRGAFLATVGWSSMSQAQGYPLTYTVTKTTTSGGGNTTGNSACAGQDSSQTQTLPPLTLYVLTQSSTQSTSSINCIGVSYALGQTTSGSQGISDGVNLNDAAPASSSKSPPPTVPVPSQPISIYLDTEFNGIMFQDQNAPGPMPQSEYLKLKLAGGMVHPPVVRRLPPIGAPPR